MRSRFVEYDSPAILVCSECGQKLILFGVPDEDDKICSCGGKMIVEHEYVCNNF